MNYMKSNKKGVKLLAAAMVLVMAFAAVTVVGFADDSDAEDQNIPANAIADPVVASTAYYVQGEASSTIPAAATSGVEIVLKVGSEITLSATSVSGASAVKIYVTKNSDTQYDDAKYITITTISGKSMEVTVKNDNGTMKVSTSNVVGVNFALAITGSAPVEVASTVVSSAEVSGLDYGILVKDNTATNKYTYYIKGYNAKTITLEESDEVSIVNGSVIITQGNNIVKAVDAVCSTAITVAYGATFPTINNGTVSGGSIKVTSGYFGTVTGVATGISAVAIYESSTLKGYTYNIREYNATQAFSFSNIANLKYTILGEVVQNTSFTPTTGTPITVAANSTFAVANGVTIKVGAITLADDTSTIKSLGILETSSGTITTTDYSNGYGKVLVGPAGLIKTSSDIVDATGTTNVDSGKDTTVTGNVTAIGTSVIGNDDMTVPEGITVTLNGDLGLNGNTLFVNGTLIIAEGSSIFGTGNTTELIVLGANGKIINNGKMGAVYGVNIADVNDNNKYVKIQGVSGAEFAYKSNALTVTGDIQTVRNVAGTNTISITNVPVTGEFTIGKKVTLSGSTVNVLKNSVVTIDGSLSTGVTLNEGAQITINGAISASTTISVVVGTYASGDNTFTPGTSVSVGTNETEVATGFTVYSKRVAVPGAGDSVNYELKAYINGTIDDGDKTNVSTTPTIVIGQTINVAAGETLLVKEDAKLTVSNTIVLDGKVTIENNEGTGRKIAEENYLGAAYTVTGTETNAKQTGYYTNVLDAMSAIETADDKKVTINVLNLDQSIIVKDGQEIKLTVSNGSTRTIGTDAVVTAEAGSVGSITADVVNGMVIISGDSEVTASITSYASKKTGTDGTVTYAGFTVAVKNASVGDIINIGSADVGTITSGETVTARESLAVPAGVTIQVSETLRITGNLTIPETSKLVGGTLKILGNANNKSEIKVAGTLDLSNGILTGSNYVVSSTGEVITQTKIAATSMNGAYLQNTDGNYVLTSVANAVKYAKDNGIANVNVNGTYSESGAITLDGVNLIIDDSSNVTLGDVTIAAGKKITATGDLTANVIAKCGSTETTGAVSDAIVKLVKSSLTLESKKVTSASGVDTYTFTISAIDGEMTVAQGIVTVSSAIDTTSLANAAKFTIAEGAELSVKNALTIDGDKVAFVNNGTITVKGATLVFSAGPDKVAVMAGTLNVADQGIVNAYALDITGTVNIVKTAEENGTFTVYGTEVTVGTPITSLGAAASIIGPVAFYSNAYFLAYAGADLSKAVMDELSTKSTEFFVNGVSYATAYTQGSVNIVTYDSGPTNIVNSVIDKDMLNKISGVVSTDKFIWSDSEGNLVPTQTKIGDKDALYYEMTVASANVKISIGTGISLWIDGVKAENTGATTAPIQVGEHTVKVTIDPGYKGTATITLNGKTITDGNLVITSDMIGGNNVLSATGDITIDAGEAPAPAEKDDSGMGITDYLLIVLVILAAILVVVVAIRMMRS